MTSNMLIKENIYTYQVKDYLLNKSRVNQSRVSDVSHWYDVTMVITEARIFHSHQAVNGWNWRKLEQRACAYI